MQIFYDFLNISQPSPETRMFVVGQTKMYLIIHEILSDVIHIHPLIFRMFPTIPVGFTPLKPPFPKGKSTGRRTSAAHLPVADVTGGRTATAHGRSRGMHRRRTRGARAEGFRKGYLVVDFFSPQEFYKL